MPLSTISSMSSPTPSRYPDLPVPRTQSVSEFEVEHSVTGKTPYTPSKPRRRGSDPEYDSQAAYRAAIAAIVSAKAQPFAVSGRVPMDPSNLTLFFRSKVRRPRSLLRYGVMVDGTLFSRARVERDQPLAGLPYRC